MDLYWAHGVCIRAEDMDKATVILDEYDRKGFLDDYTIDSIRNKDRDGNIIVTYRIKPYISEDLDLIINDFRKAGIQIM